MVMVFPKSVKMNLEPCTVYNKHVVAMYYMKYFSSTPFPHAVYEWYNRTRGAASTKPPPHPPWASTPAYTITGNSVNNAALNIGLDLYKKKNIIEN